MKTPFSVAAAALTVGMMSFLPATATNAQGVAVAAQAQVSQIDKRVTTLEGQMRAVQRQVFPGGDKRFFAPQITAEPAPLPPADDQSGANAVVDLLQRVNALEAQQRDLTGQIEQLQFKLRQTEQMLNKWRGDTDFRLEALEKTSSAGTALSGAPEPDSA